jgi:hypothetical protein
VLSFDLTQRASDIFQRPALRRNSELHCDERGANHERRGERVADKQPAAAAALD